MVGIYKITNLVNNKIYIGQSINIKRRFEEHHYKPFYQKGDEYNIPLYRAIRKYGVDNFNFEVIEECLPEELNDKEQYWIQYYNSYIQNNCGYNLTYGGDGRATILHEKILNLWDNKKSISVIAKELEICKASVINHLEGYINYSSDEAKKRGYELLKTDKKVKLYDLKLNLLNSFNNPEEAAKSLNVTVDSIKNCCQHRTHSCKGYILCWENETPNLITKRKKVLQFDLNGELIQSYIGVNEAARQTQIDSANISRCCNGKAKTAGGYVWKYEV